jgi:mono/diheme cytochrome c family protein
MANLKRLRVAQPFCRAIAFLPLLLVVAPARADEQAVRRGARIYSNNCSNCHGDDLQNNSPIAFDLRRLHDEEHLRFVTSVTNGKNAMPSWDGALTPEQIEDVWAYVRANAYDSQ